MSVQIMLEKDLSLRKALYYSGLSSSTYFYKPVPRQAGSRTDPLIVGKVKEIALNRPSYGARRRIAAVMSPELDAPVNRKRIGRVSRVLNWTLPRRKKNEIIRSSARLVKATRPYELWETDITFVWCGVDGWCYLFNVLDVFQREWLGYAFDTSAVKENAIMSANNVLAAHPQVDASKLTLRCDNGSQYRSRAFRESMRALGIKLEFIYYSTPQHS